MNPDDFCSDTMLGNHITRKAKAGGFRANNVYQTSSTSENGIIIL